VLCYLSVFSYQKNGCGGKMILALKDRKDRRIARLLGKDMAKVLQNGCILEEGAIVTFVPRSREAVLSRGVDQARVLAKETAEVLGLEMAPCLSSNDVGVAQKELSAVKREEAADEKYVLSKKAPSLAGRQVILVDDVLTTGATLGAYARLLKQAGARTVICLTAGQR
jgi:predicted amidophosphoribosyltransferase